jgi:hypothetical protein
VLREWSCHALRCSATWQTCLALGMQVRQGPVGGRGHVGPGRQVEECGGLRN